MRLIDADALWETIEKDRAESDMPKMWHKGIGYAIYHIIHAPTVDAVQVVRCKDCKHYREADPGHPDCDWCNRMICGTIRKGFFCADGERRSE